MDCTKKQQRSLVLSLSVWLILGCCPVAVAQVGRFNHDAAGNLSARSNAAMAGPVILGQPVSAAVDPGGITTFGVAVADAAGATYQWLLNGSALAGATSDNLTVTNVAGGSQGSYSVVVSNISGVVTSAVAHPFLNFDQIKVWGENLYFQAGVPAGPNQRALLLTAGSNDVVNIVAGINHTLALKSDHTVVGWGANDFGQATPPPGLSNVVAVAAGETHSLVLLANGTVIAWGENTYRQTNVPPSLTNVVSIAAGRAHNLALRADGQVVAWGDGSAGQTNVPLGLDGIVALAAGWRHSLALGAGGKVFAWGGNFSQTNVPSNLSDVVSIAAGRTPFTGHNLALRRDGTIVGWGDDYYGQATSPADLSNVVAIAAGGLHSLALKSDGSVVAWGRNLSGQTNVPSGLSNVVAIAAGNNHSVALIGAAPDVYRPVLLAPAAVVSVQNQSVTLRVGAKNFVGAFSANGLPPGLSIDPVSGLISGIPTVAGTFMVSLSASNSVGVSQATLTLTVLSPIPRIYSRAYALAYTGNDVGYQILANNQPTSYGASGLPPGAIVDTASGAIHGQPEAVGVFPVTISASNFYGTGTASLSLEVRSVAVFGNNSSGQTNVPIGLSNVVAVAAGGDTTYALKEDGRVVAWGYNSSGQTNVPGSLANVVDITSGGNHSLALKSDGTVRAWGYNGYTQTNVPAGLSNVVGVAAGANHSLALKSDGTLVGWGDITYGQGRAPDGLGNVVAVAAGANHSLALKAGGTVVAWGYNGYGQASVPLALSSVVAIAAGGYHSLALKSDGTVVAWGWSPYGQTNVPPGLNNVVAIAAGQHYSLALQANGIVVGWGLNTDGQGNAPGNLRSVVTVSAGRAHTVALTAGEPGVTGPMILNRAPLLGVMDSPFSYRVLAKNGPTSFSALGLPPGLSLNPATGLLSGIPSVSGTFSVTLIVANAAGTNQLTVALTVLRPTPRIYSTLSMAAYTGNDFDYQILADNSPANYDATGLPPGLTVNPATGEITGQPAAVGLFPVTLRALNSYGQGTATLQLDVRMVAAWGRNNRGQTNLPTGLDNLVAITGGGDTTYALRGDGRVLAWGDNSYSQTNVPAGLSNVIAIAAGLYHVIALKTDGTVAGWGYNGFKQTNAPAGLSNVVELACGYHHNLALRANGTVAAWGNNANRQCNVPVGLSNAVQVAAGGNYSMALRDDGTVALWGIFTNLLASLSNVVAIAGGNNSQLALKADGTVVAWNGVTNVPAGLSNVVAIVAGAAHDVALRADGSVLAWGDNSSGQLTLPPDLMRVAAIGAGASHTLALTVLPQPELGIERNNSDVVVSWPLSMSAFSLQSSDRVTAGVWTNFFVLPAVSGDLNYLTFPRSADQQFFRLRCK